MDIQTIVTHLKQHVARIDEAIAALGGSGQTAPRRGRPAKSSQPAKVGRRGPRTMSAAARARIAAAKKAWWAKQKGKSGAQPSKPAPKKATRHRMSPAARKKLSALMKARWAARKKQA